MAKMRKTIVANDAKIFQNPFAKAAVQIFHIYRLPRGAKQKKIQNYVQEEASLFFFFFKFWEEILPNLFPVWPN